MRRILCLTYTNLYVPILRTPFMIFSRYQILTFVILNLNKHMHDIYLAELQLYMEHSLEKVTLKFESIPSQSSVLLFPHDNESENKSGE